MRKIASFDGIGNRLSLRRSLRKGSVLMMGPRFEVIAQNRVRVFKTPSEDEAKRWTEQLAKISMMRCVTDDYKIQTDQKLGAGFFAVVYQGKCHLDDEVVAVKVIDKTKLSQSERECMFREIAILKSVKSKTLVGLHDAYETTMDLFLVLDYVAGEQLLERLEREGAVNETTGALIARQILHGVSYLHRNAIVHRDLKLSNIMYTTKRSHSVKILDFGYSTYARQPGDLSMPVGTIKYFAPEICKGDNYSKEVDMWAFGTIMYTLMVGSFPFNAKEGDEIELMQSIKTGRFNAVDQDYKNLTTECKGMLRSLFKVDPRERATVEKCLDHPWITNSVASPTSCTTIDNAPEHTSPEAPIASGDGERKACKS